MFEAPSSSGLGRQVFILKVAGPNPAGVTVAKGLLVLFGSGETGAVGKTIHRKVFQLLRKRDQRVAVLEIPAGVQPNSEIVANEGADVFRKSLREFVSSVSVVPARKKTAERLPRRPDEIGTPRNDDFDFSPDNPEILEPLKQASYIFLGPGSPTYARKQLENSLALNMILDRWENGAVLALSSAAALAAGNFTLPVYEIYKVGSDLYWENGLRLTEKIGLNLTIITHWNNLEGGKDLDTGRCFMGKKRFADLEKLLTAGETILGIDEHTAVIIDPAAGVLTVWGKGSGRLAVNGTETELKNGVVYDLNFQKKSGDYFSIGAIEKDLRETVGENELPESIRELLAKRKISRDNGLFGEADEIRRILLGFGYEIRDEESGQKAYIN